MTNHEDCVQCDPCVTEFCLAEILCLYSCGCCCTLPIRIVPNRMLAAGTILAQRQEDELWDAFDPDAENGLQIPRGVLRYNVNTDASGRLQNFISPWNSACPPLVTNVYYCGTFRIEETIGDLGAALSHPGFGRLIEGFLNGQGTWKLN